MNPDVNEVCLVGAGPVGIECAIALKQAGIQCLHLERSNLASTIEWYAPGTTFFSSADRIALAGVPLYTPQQGKATREDYLLYLRSLVTQFELDISLGTELVDCSKKGDGFELTVRREDKEEKIYAKKIILAIGDMHKPRLLGIPGEDLPHVSHYFEEPHSYFGRKVLIVGGKNSAVEAAIRLERVGCDVSISYRGTEFDKKRVKYWLYPELMYQIREKKIGFLKHTEITEIRPGEVDLKDLKTGGTRREKVDKVLLLTGYEQEKALFEKIGVSLEDEQERPRLNRDTFETDVPGVYVIGTATAGTQIGGVTEFIETSHEHIAKVLKALTGNEGFTYRRSDPNFLEN